MDRKANKIICPSCGSGNLPGTLFCVQCGTYLPSGGPLRTEILPEQIEGKSAYPQLDESPEQILMKPLNIEVVVINTGRKVLLSTEQEILVGRLDAAHGIFPELDMTPDGGLEQGVSRRHARIYAREGTCFLEDLDSTNGTFLNDERVTPYLPYAFKNDDMLTFGTMQVQVQIYTEN
jgi:pSer/pThr/pTyr-binding forkhead associated (FHA) protein